MTMPPKYETLFKEGDRVRLTGRILPYLGDDCDPGRGDCGTKDGRGEWDHDYGCVVYDVEFDDFGLYGVQEYKLKPVKREKRERAKAAH